MREEFSPNHLEVIHFQRIPKVEDAVAMEEYRRRFDVIEFAIYCRDWETANYDAFKAWCK